MGQLRMQISGESGSVFDATQHRPAVHSGYHAAAEFGAILSGIPSQYCYEMLAAVCSYGQFICLF